MANVLRIGSAARHWTASRLLTYLRNYRRLLPNRRAYEYEYAECAHD
jgi:hypothetical protein